MTRLGLGLGDLWCCWTTLPTLSVGVLRCTALGGRNETSALRQACGGAGAFTLGLGACKFQIARSEGAAGMAGLVKLIHTLLQCSTLPKLQLQQRGPGLEGFRVLLEHFSKHAEVEAVADEKDQL